jgi:hypothetical protein
MSAASSDVRLYVELFKARWRPAGRNENLGDSAGAIIE